MTNYLSALKPGLVIIVLGLLLTACQLTGRQTDTTPPTVAWSSPEANASVTGTVILRVTASDAGSGMARVEFYVADTLIGTDSDTGDNTFSVNWDTGAHANGAVTLKAVAFDKANNRAEATRPVNVGPGGPADTGEALDHATDNAMKMWSAFVQGRGSATASSMPPGLLDKGMLLPLAASALGGGPLAPLSRYAAETSELPRGTWQWVPDEHWGEWTQVSPEPSDGVVMRWTAVDPQAASYDAELAVHWRGTAVVSSSWGDTIEVPTSAAISLTVAGEMLADIDFTASYYAGTGCPGGIDELTSLSLVGWIGDESGKAAFDIAYTLTAQRMTTTGDLTLSAGSDAFSFAWDILANGTLTREANCFTKDFVVTDGSIAFGAASTEDGATTSFALFVDYSNIVYGDYGEFSSVQLANGSLKIDDVTVVTFSGTLDESMENVTLTFASGASMSLREFLAAYDWDDNIGPVMLGTALHRLHD